MTEQTAEQIFKAAWHAADERGEIGGRVTAGLEALRAAGLFVSPPTPTIHVIEQTAERTPEQIVAEAMVNAGAPLMHSRVEDAVVAALRAAGLLVSPPSDDMIERAAMVLYETVDDYVHFTWQEYVIEYPERASSLRAEARRALTAAGVAPQGVEKVDGLDVNDWARIARAKDEANAASVAAIDELADAIRLTVEYVGNDWLPPAEGWSWFDALMKHRPEVAQPFVIRPILLHPDQRPVGVTPPEGAKPIDKVPERAKNARDSSHVATAEHSCGVEAAREFLAAALAESDADERDPDGGSGWDVEVDARTVLGLLDDDGDAPREPGDFDFGSACPWCDPDNRGTDYSEAAHTERHREVRSAPQEHWCAEDDHKGEFCKACGEVRDA